MYRLRNGVFPALTWFVLSCGVATAMQVANVSVVLTFDRETPGLKRGSPIRGLSISGVTFDFTRAGLASNDAFYGGVIHRTPGGPSRVLANVHEPALEGNAAGVLTMTFATPTPQLSFGIARSTATGSATVQLLDRLGKPISTTQVTLTTSGPVSEGAFSYANQAQRVKTAVISFPNPAPNSRFAIDNLSFLASS